MTKTYTDLIKEDLQRQFKFNHVDEYHRLGYKGKDICILNHESYTEHAEMTRQVLTDYVPEATILESYIGCNIIGDKVIDMHIVIGDEIIDFERAVKRYNIKIVTASFGHKVSDAKLRYLRDISKRKGVIFLCAAGNENTDGVTGIYSKDDTAITVGAIRLRDTGKIERKRYSSVGPELDFTMFMGRGEGTSAASPALAGIIALLLQRYGDFNQFQCIELLKSICLDLSGQGRDDYFGYGVPILPLTDTIPYTAEYIF